jgi:Fe-S cluster assembly ATP-binding protein
VATSNDNELIRVEKVTKEYNNGAIKALFESDMTVARGEVVAIIGPSGSGKSTLLRCLNMLETPTSGRILLDGVDITEKSITERAQMGISFAFQQPVRFKGIQVLDLIRLASGKHLSPADACEYLSKVGLCAKDYIRREVNASLSGGELKRIEIATVLARKTRLSLFDEPEAGIDLWSFQNLIEVFENMRSSIKDSSIVIISHQERILNIADEIVVISDGHIEDQGPREELLPRLIGTSSAIDICRRLEQPAEPARC